MKHVVCIGRKQNLEFLSRLKRAGFVFSGGLAVEPHHLRYTAVYTDDDGAANQAAVYALDEKLRLVAYHNSMSLLKLEQESDELLSYEEYVGGLTGRNLPVILSWKRWSEES